MHEHTRTDPLEHPESRTCHSSHCKTISVAERLLKISTLVLHWGYKFLKSIMIRKTFDSKITQD